MIGLRSFGEGASHNNIIMNIIRKIVIGENNNIMG
jgi:hypothetical protein